MHITIVPHPFQNHEWHFDIIQNRITKYLSQHGNQELVSFLWDMFWPLGSRVHLVTDFVHHHLEFKCAPPSLSPSPSLLLGWQYRSKVAAVRDKKCLLCQFMEIHWEVLERMRHEILPLVWGLWHQTLPTGICKLSGAVAGSWWINEGQHKSQNNSLDHSLPYLVISNVISVNICFLFWFYETYSWFLGPC